MATFAQFERDLILERTMHGLQKARERGVVGGVEKLYSDEQIKAAVAEAGGNYLKASRALKCSKTTILRRMRKMQAAT